MKWTCRTFITVYIKKLTCLDGMLEVKTGSVSVEFLQRAPDVVSKSDHMRYTLFLHTPNTIKTEQC